MSTAPAPAAPATPAAPLRAALYLRISLDQTGEEAGIDRQREACLKLCEFRGWKVVEEYKDNSVSATKRKPRPAYEQMRRDAEAGSFDAVVVYKLDRLTRRPIEIEDWIDLNERRGVTVATAEGDLDLSTGTGRMVAGILANVARGEVQIKAARQRDAARQRAEKGRPPLGVRLTGYTAKGDLIPAEAAFVKTAFERFARGDSLRALATWAEEEGVPTRHGKPWNPSTIRTLLRNPRYAGHAIYMGERNGRSGAWTPIVDDDTFTLVQVKLTDPRRRTHQGTDRKHIGSGLYRCGECDARLTSWTGGRYHCPNGHLTRAMHHIDAAVLGVIRERIGRSDAAALARRKGSTKKAKAARETVEKLRARIERVNAEYDAGVIDGVRLRAATSQAQAELQAAEAELARATSMSSHILLARDPVAEFDGSPLMIRRAFIDALCIVRVYPAARGSRTFDPYSVAVDWT